MTFFAQTNVVLSVIQHFKHSVEKACISETVFTDVVPCEILDTNYSAWLKGKLITKVILEFIPD
jgi:hypothetical protein